MELPNPGYVVFIDEAGDPGIKSSPSVPAWTEWFTLGAVVVAAHREPEVRGWIEEMRNVTRSRQKPDLHYRNLSLSNKRRVARMLASKGVRLFALASHKANMRGHRSAALGRMSPDQYYNWCLRFLLERVTAWCARRAKQDHVSPVIKIVFSERGGHRYPDLVGYLKKLEYQARAGTLTLKARHIVPGVLVPELCEVRPHTSVAGLQLADIVASAFFQAANSALPTHELSPARLLSERMAKEGRSRVHANFGLTLLPLPHQGTIPAAERAIFEFYGYDFSAR
ncbi:DUF3800 domain-containing protein [Sphingomonas sp. KR1UV-12]|uniref:DUF3800 domain-containing protein n=1 Tax=Sphingomonas aurea TaxID=3063994 RepID=A0ABT9EH42_9SPHN|nr:DUF3800 domain-containing protein [Sphingomonas sp. KR1UV-12]MDP1026291.1 DUF3800 domain-containing protein [Sphingomonas sp. KR1UV-12]